MLVRIVYAAVIPLDYKIRSRSFSRNVPLHPGILCFRSCRGGAQELVKMPGNLTFEDAATIKAGAETAWKALFTEGELQPGQTVLIHAAAGGVGQFAVQLAKWKGATVIATASTPNLDFVKSLGADQVIDYTRAAFEDVVKEVDLVVDCRWYD